MIDREILPHLEMGIQVRPHRSLVPVTQRNHKVEGLDVADELQRPQQRIASEHGHDVVEVGDVVRARHECLLSRRRPIRVDHDEDIDVSKPLLRRHDREIDLIGQQIPQRVMLVGEVEDPEQCRGRLRIAVVLPCHRVVCLAPIDPRHHYT